MPKTTVLRSSEGALLNRIRRAVLSAGEAGIGSVQLGIGDDAAVLKARRGRELVLSSDFLIEGIHFLDSGPRAAKGIGFKALARAVSDLAAMGAQPVGFLLNLAVPRVKTGAWLDRFLAGLDRAARAFRIPLIGGDLAGGVEKTVICVVVIGDGIRSRLIRRSGAVVGDLIYVSGRLGAARLGLEVILRGLRGRRGAGSLVKPHFYPKPRLKLGNWLAHRTVATAMMDISDGLSTDLARLCEASGVGAVIRADRVPAVRIPEAWRRRLRLRSGAALDFALKGGDDYELLFTVPPGRAQRLAPISPDGVPLTCIGEITRGRKLELVTTAGTRSVLRPRGWDHFQRA